MDIKYITIIAGGRDFIPTKEHERWLDSLPIKEVVSGHARGADTFGENWGYKNNLKVKLFPANWKMFGKQAGYIRNTEMAEYAEAVALFPGGRGTAHMEKIARERGLVIFKFC